MAFNINLNKSATRNKWLTTHYKQDDLPAIGLFFKKLYKGEGEYGNMAFFHWKIVKNYIQPGIINLIKDGNIIASTTSITPKLLVYKGEFVHAAEIGDTYTHPDYWRQGMFAKLVNQTKKDAENNGINFIYGTPNELSLPGYQKKANFIIIKNLHVRSFVFPINIGPSFQKKCHWLLGSLAGNVFSIFSYTYFKIKKCINFYEKSIVIEEINCVPLDWNNFWKQAQEAYDFIINRNDEATVWRYINSPNKYKIYSLRKNNNLIGYFVIMIKHSEESKRIVIADYLTLPKEEKVLAVGINHVIERSFAIGANRVILWCAEGSPYQKIFERIGFFARGFVPVICYKNKFSEKLENCNSWHFTMGDSDNI